MSEKDLKDTAVAAARKKFMPEFLNRLDDVVMFNTLTPSDLVQILEIELEKLRIMSARAGKTVMICPSPSAKKQILTEGYDKKYNARELRRAVERRILQPLSRCLASGQLESLDTAIIDYHDGDWSYHVEKNF
ncbi:MAG: hypothetical protein C5B59_06655 [Bacteroidetes bacterium]|nr:MAG: hypothetical protein C5B59_06655 [Bacteroidota bacterium]